MKIYKPAPIKQLSRKDWIKYFYFKVKDGWNNTKSEPLTFKTLAIRMLNVPNEEMMTLKRLCEESKDFDKFFWWRIKMYPRRKKEKKPESLRLF